MADPGPSATERLSSDLSLIGDQERAGDYTAAGAAAARVAQIEAALAGQYGTLTDRDRLTLRADLADARRQQAEATRATEANTSELERLRQEIAKQTAVYDRIGFVQLAEITRALADMVSGQLGGQAAGRQLMPGAGALARY